MSSVRPTAGLMRPRPSAARECWTWELRRGETVLAQGRKPTRASALAVLRHCARQSVTPAAALEARLVYQGAGVTARERVPIAQLLGESPPQNARGNRPAPA